VQSKTSNQWLEPLGSARSQQTMAMVTESNWEEQKVMVVCVLDSGIDAYAPDLQGG